MCKLPTVLKINVGLFSLIGVLHLLRILLQWDVRFGDWQVPYWMNVLGIVIAGVMVWLNGKHLKTS